MKKISSIALSFYCLFGISCSDTNDEASQPVNAAPGQNQTPDNLVHYKYLALGDSYTIGESVCDTCRFPAQLSRQIEKTLSDTAVDFQIIARTGWTTTDLINAVNTQNPSADNDLVTLLIGVNNQYQHKPFSLYEQEFPQLVNKAIALAKGDSANVIVVSIPDYAFTPFGQSTGQTAAITAEIDQYNAFAGNYCVQNNIAFVNITDITREALQHYDLIATDGLHPSGLAYSRFVERILPKAIVAITQ